MNIDWKKKLSSRKFWAAASALVIALCALFGIDELTVEKLSAMISALGVLMAYIFTEGYLDSKAMDTEDTSTQAKEDEQDEAVE